MNDAEKIDHLIEVIKELKDMVKDMDEPKSNHDLIMGLMLAIIVSTPVPDVTILPYYRRVAIA